ncbi:hypothetical protein [Paenibacillus sp. YIM B09110]|uniref:hypothetical protein n=1 Tax=Paenibacillus sp. YIM B09110 TaxID=3126102 RepID=UPI00301E60A6
MEGIRPLSYGYGIPFNQQGIQLYFVLNQPKKLAIEVNDMYRLAATPAKERYDVRILSGRQVLEMIVE